MFSQSSLLAVAFLVSHTLTAPNPAAGTCPPTPISLRLPTNYEFNPALSWPQPTAEYLYGNWKVTCSSSIVYQTFFTDFENDYSPAFPQSPAGLRNDVASYYNSTLPDTAPLFTLYAHDRPTSSVFPTAVFNYTVNKAEFITDVFEIIGWGLDENGVEYAVIYETQVVVEGIGEVIDILSRVEDGPGQKTVSGIISGLEGLGNANVKALAQSMQKLKRDGRRSGKAPVVCDQACVDNVSTLGGQ